MSIFNTKTIDNKKQQFPHWYSPETGIYQSKYPSINLPSDPFLDVVTFIFSSKPHQKSVSNYEALIDSSSGVSISYSDLFPLVKSIASGLISKGVSKGDVVLALLPNSIYFPIILLGVMYSGAIFTPMNPLSTAAEIKNRVADCNPCLAFTVPDKVQALHALGISAIMVPESPRVKIDDKSGPIPNPDFSEFTRLVTIARDNDTTVTAPVINQDDTAAIMYSSGTTGASKGVVLSHGNFIAMVEVFVRFEASLYEYQSWQVVYLALLPMFHVYGMCHFAMGLLALGSKVVVMKRFDIKEVVNSIEKFKVTHLTVVPPILPFLTKAAKEVGGQKRFESLKQVSFGAAPSSRKIIQDLVQTLPHVDFIQGYGMTETTATGCRGFNTKKLRNYSSAGLLLPNTQAKVVDWKTGSFLPPGSIGELWLRGPGVMKGYLNNAAETRSTLDEDGWLRTGDIVYFDQNAYLYIIDRLKEMIKYKGFQIAPADLESVLASHPEILDFGVAGVTDEECGEIPVAFVVRRQGSSLSHEDVMNYVARQCVLSIKTRYKKSILLMFG
ncbi:hypothetical protein TIFTF001_031844 [Ficus carica]|uniref:4-coumarate--CoA ligase n=1 Tax=Ficus carica TaxID=3494 RepID=A0AA88DVD8_FICCA|nr:hypothetical protein TIFTF001_031844 [Ficus carica]